MNGLRPYRPDDAVALADLYRESVLILGADHYTTEQLAQWASWASNSDEFARNLAGGFTLVAEVENEVAGFGRLHPENHVHLLYTSPKFARRGIATTLYLALEEHARRYGATELTTNASRVSKRLFEKHGYSVLAIESPVRGGVAIERFQMRKPLLHPTD